MERVASTADGSSRKDVCPRGNPASGSVQSAPVDEDVHWSGEEPVLRGDRAGWKVRDQGTAARRVHYRLCAGKARRADAEGDAGGERLENSGHHVQAVNLEVQGGVFCP